MKIIKGKLRLILLISLTISIASMFTSCKNDVTDPSDPVIAHIKIVNAAEGSSSQDVYLDNIKLNNIAVAYANYSDYFLVKAGAHQAKFTNTGSIAANASSGITLDADGYYTFYYTNDGTANGNFITRDDMTAPQSGKARVRFVHLSSGTVSPVDIGLPDSIKLVTNLAYKAASAYYTVDANSTFLVYAAGTTDVALTMPTAVQAGKIYTIYFSGTTNESISYNVIAQN